MRYDRRLPLEQQNEVGRAVAVRWRRRVRRTMWSFAGAAAFAIALAGSLLVVTFTRSFGATIAAAEWINWLEEAPSFKGQPNGSHVLLEGTVAADSKTLRHQFVAYVEQSKYNSRSGMGYEVDGLHRSAFSVDTRDGRFKLTSNGYAFSIRQGLWFGGLYPKLDVLQIDWDHTAYRAGRDEGTPPGHIRLSGIARGQSVIVIGQKTTAEHINPWYVLAGTRESLIDRLRDVGTGVWFWPNAVLAIALAITLVCLIPYAIIELVRLAAKRPRASKR